MTAEQILPLRFEVRRELGSGGFGAVYEAWDRDREELVAVKLLRDLNARALFRFKQEFRALAGIVHPNLVTLYELLEQDSSWFFTMELVHGKDFLAHGRTLSTIDTLDAAGPLVGLAEQTTLDGEVPSTDPFIDARPPGTLDLNADRLRRTLEQLALGLDALHGAGKLHCDVKPSNVLITDDERVVLLDFGLIAERVEPEALRRLSQKSGGGHFFGTPHYMSPEQAQGHDLLPASDWYSVGVMLYEALSGTFPIDGKSTLQVLLRKQSRDPVDVREVNPAAPDDLADLCMSLLKRDLDERAGADEVFDLVGAQRARRSFSISFDGPATFVGRKEEMRAMRRCVTRLKEGQGSFVTISGRSGMGKTTLARTFLDTYVHSLDDVIVLEGRCHENESVPFKVFDSLIDMLSRYLEHLPASEVSGLVPHDVSALVNLFPTLLRIDALRKASEATPAHGSRLRERAFGALRELLERLGEHHRVVLFVDDVQWGDEDSATLLNHLLRPPNAPQVLIVMTFRQEDAEGNPFIHGLFDFQREYGQDASVNVALGALTAQESAALARELLDDEHASHIERLTREASGNPFLIDEFARHMRVSGVSLDSGALEGGLAAMLAERIRSLPEASRRLLCVLGVAGHPLDRRLARQVAELNDNAQVALATLSSALMVRVSSSSARRTLEPYHDLIRDVARQAVSASERAAIHLRLADALASSPNPPLELVCDHLVSADRPERAASWAMRAAHAARDSYAYGRAIDLFTRALSLREWSDDERRATLVLIGELAGFLGRGPQAVEAYEGASALAGPERAREYERRCVEQLLRSGYFEQGKGRLDALLMHSGLPVPRSQASTMTGMLTQRARLSLRGLAFEASAQELDPEMRWRMDLCWVAAQSLSTTDIMAGAYYGVIHLRDALDVGDPTQLARALTLEAMYASGSARGRGRARQLIDTAEELVAVSDDSSWSLGFVNAGRGIISYLHGDWSRAVAHLSEATRLLTEECRGVVWETDNSFIYRFLCHEQLGEIGPFLHELPHLVEEAKSRRDIHCSTMFSLFSYLGSLADDDIEGSRASLETGLASLPQRGFLLQHFRYMYGRCHTELYAGRGLAAWDELERWWAPLKRSLMLQIDCVKMLSFELRARCALAAYACAKPGERRKYAGALSRACSAMRRMPLPHGRAYADFFAAQRLVVDGERERAVDALTEVASSLDGFDHSMHSASARLTAALVGSDVALGAEICTELREQGVQQPERFVRIWSPGVMSLQ